MQPTDARPLDPLRQQLLSLLDWEDAHASFDSAVEGIPPDRYDAGHPDLPYTLWQLLEHVRRAQHDILKFCTAPEYVQPEWPADYWPEEPAPPSPMEWADSVAAFRSDRDRLKRLIRDDRIGLYEPVPHGQGQTFLREILLVADHTAYHVGQMIALRRLTGLWE